MYNFKFKLLMKYSENDVIAVKADGVLNAWIEIGRIAGRLRGSCEGILLLSVREINQK